MPSHILYAISVTETKTGTEFPSQFLLALDGDPKTHDERILNAVCSYRGSMSAEDLDDDADEIDCGDGIAVSLDFDTKIIEPQKAEALLDVLPLVPEFDGQFPTLAEARKAIQAPPVSNDPIAVYVEGGMVIDTIGDRDVVVVDYDIEGATETVAVEQGGGGTADACVSVHTSAQDKTATPYVSALKHYLDLTGTQENNECHEARVVPFTLKDKSVTDSPELEGAIRVTDQGVSLAVKGHSDFYSNDTAGEVAMLELWEGKLLLRAWADINTDDCTHSIDLSGAKTELREADENDDGIDAPQP